VLDAAGDIAARSLVRRASAAATLVVCFSLLQPRGASSANPEYSTRILQTSGPLGFKERGIDLGDGRFWPGTTGSEWTTPMKEDIERAQKGTGSSAHPCSRRPSCPIAAAPQAQSSCALRRVRRRVTVCAWRRQGVHGLEKDIVERCKLLRTTAGERNMGRQSDGSSQLLLPGPSATDGVSNCGKVHAQAGL
jgi:hypothetical protein